MWRWINKIRWTTWSWPSFVTKIRSIWQWVLQPHFEASVRMKLTLPKVGTWSPLGLLKTQSSIAGVKTPCIEVFLILLKRSWSVDVENDLAWTIRTSVAQVMVKRKAEVKLPVWLPTTKSRESTWRWCVHVECNTSLERSRGELQVCFRPHLNWSLNWELWAFEVLGVQIRTVSGLLLGNPGTKSHLNVSAMGKRKEYYMGEGGGFPRVLVVVSQVSPCCPWLVPTPKMISNVN
jgi:hypothetical protein